MIKESNPKHCQGNYKSNYINDNVARIHNNTIKLTSAFSDKNITNDTHNTYNDVSDNKIIHNYFLNYSNFDIITPKTKNPAENIEPKTKVNKLTCPE